MSVRLFRILFGLALVSALLGSLPVHSQETDPDDRRKPRGTREKPDPIQEAETVQSPLEHPDQALLSMMVSHGFKAEDAKVLPGVEVISEEIKIWRSFIADDSIPNKEKFIYVTRYGLNEEVAKTLIEAKKAGFARVALITDLNNAMDGEFKEKEQYHSDFENAKWKNTPHARAIQLMIEAGITINHKSFSTTVSQPLFNDADPTRDPLEHEKAAVMGRVENENAKAHRLIISTANLNEPYRYNRTFVIEEPNLAQLAVEHAELEINGFRDGKTIAQLDVVKPRKVLFGENGKNGYIWLGFTDGRYELNQMIREVLNEAIAGKYQIKNIYSSNFVTTNGTVILNGMKNEPNGIQGVMRAAKEQNWGNGEWKTRLFMVSDERATRPNAFELSPVVAGFPIIRAGRYIPPFRMDLNGRVNDVADDMVEVYSYQRGIEGREVTDPNGAPVNVYVWHDKTTIIHTVEANGEWLYIFTGNYNLSGNFHNAEFRKVIKIRADRAFSRDMVSSIVDVVKNEPQYALRMDREGGMRTYLALMMGLDVRNIPVGLVKEFIGALELGNLEKIKEILIEVKDLPNKISKRPKNEVLQERIDRFMRFVTWYETNSTEMPYRHMNLVKYATLITALTQTDKISDYAARAMMGEIFYFKTAGLSEEEKTEVYKKKEVLMKKGWEELGFKEPLAEFKPKEPATETPAKETKEKNETKPAKETKKPKTAAKKKTAPKPASGAAAICKGLFKKAS